ncbi:MAG: hypothetical protein R3D00_23005 [Bacteroidia bacterium]
MIKKSISAIVLGLCMWATLVAQPEAPTLVSGIKAFQQEDYETSIRILAKLIEDEGPVSKINLPEAHFYLAQAYYQISKDPVKAAIYPEALLRAYNHLMASKNTDSPGSGYQRIADVALEVLWPAIYNTGVDAYNQQDFNRAVVFFSKARQINPRFFESALNQGYAHWQVGDTLAAIKSWQKSLELYRILKNDENQRTLETTLLMLAGAYSQRNMPEEARAFLLEGMALFPGRYAFHEAEIVLYNLHENLPPGPENRFREIIHENPYDISAKLALAKHLENSGNHASALKLFEEIISQKPVHFEANLHVASYYINQAIALETQNKSTREALPPAFHANLEKAVPCLKVLHEAQPDNTEWLRQLATSTQILGLEEAESYRKLLKKASQ